jgi:hypothetical protein
MWSAWLSLKMYHRLPSQELEVEDSIAAYCLDKAVMWFGITLENLLGERNEIGEGKDKRWENKYELGDLLDPAFRVPKPMPKPKKQAAAGLGGLAMMMALAKDKSSGVKLWGVKPS